MNLRIVQNGYIKVGPVYVFRYLVVPVGMDAEDGLAFCRIADAKAAAKAWIKADSVFARKTVADEKRAVNAAERATKSEQKSAERAAEKLAAEEAVLAEKKAKLEAFNAAGTFALVG